MVTVEDWELVLIAKVSRMVYAESGIGDFGVKAITVYE